MMHSDDIELIQAGIDGELDQSGMLRLETLLAESAEAREQHEMLLRLDKFLSQVEPVEPPASLHGNIVGAITLPRSSGNSWRNVLDWLPGFARYGLAATAAVVLTLVVYQNGSQLDGVEYDSLVGTIATRAQELDRFEFSEASVSGTVRLLERKDYLALEFELNSDQPVRFDVDFSNSGLRFDAFTQDDLNLEAVSFTQTTLSASTEGSQRFMMLMRRDDESKISGDPSIDLKLSQGSQLLESGQLKP